jgi:hypothetical protein
VNGERGLETVKLKGEGGGDHQKLNGRWGWRVFKLSIKGQRGEADKSGVNRKDLAWLTSRYFLTKQEY